MKRLLTLLALAFCLVPIANAQTMNGNRPPWTQATMPNWFGAWYEWINPMEYTVTTNWSITTTGSTPTAVVTAAKGGSMVLTCTSSANDKVSIVEKTANCKPAAGDTFGFTTEFVTGASVATCNFNQGLVSSSSNANALTVTTGYIADGVALVGVAGTLYLWTAKTATTTATMTTYNLGTLANSTTYRYTVLVRCSPSTSGAGDIKVYRTTVGSNSLGTTLVLSTKASTDIPDGVSLYGALGILAISTDSNVITNNAFGWGCNR